MKASVVMASFRFVALAVLAAAASVSGQRIRSRRAMLQLESLSDEAPHMLERFLSMPGVDQGPAEDDGGGPPSLVGTAWRALEIPAVGEPGGITVSFDADRIYGSAGCNRYRGDAAQSPSSSSFVTRGEFSLTRKYCSGAMERERGYLALMSNRTFHYVVGEGAGGSIELVLYDDDTARGGTVLARFAEDVEDASAPTAEET